MVAATVFVLVFISVGLGTVFVAMRSGRGGAGPNGSPRRSSRRAFLIGLPLLMLIVGVGVPTVVLARNGHHHAEVGPGGIALTNNKKTHVDEVEGRRQFALHCSTCHTLHGANAVGKVGPNLDNLIGGLPDTARVGFILDAITNGRARGQGQMPAQLVVGVDAKDVAAFVAKVAGH